MTKTVPTRIEDLNFLVGNWTAEIWDGTFEEHWLPAANGLMQGMSRHVVAEEAPFMEFASIEPSEKGLVMWMIIGRPSLGDKKPIPFHLIEFKNGRAVFYNETNLYPSKMIYWASESGTLNCRLEGKQNEKESFDDFKFHRII